MRRTLCIFLMSLLCLGAAGQNAQQERRAKLEKEIEQLEKQLRNADAKRSDALTSLSLLQKKTAARKRLIADSERELRLLGDSIYFKQRQINRLQERLDTMGLYYSKLVRNAYLNRDAKVWYMYIIASEDIGQAFRRYGYLRSLSNRMNSQAEKIKEARSEMQSQLSDMRQLRERAVRLKKSRESELGRLKAEETQNRQLVARLKKDQTRYKKQIDSKKTQVESLNREIKKLIAKSSSREKVNLKPEELKLSNDFASNRGALPWPVEGPVVESFGQHYHPVYKNVKLPFNNGINIAVDRGTPVKAVFNGVVKNVIVMPGYGKCVLVQHGSYFTFYCRLGAVSVKSGQKVSTGQNLGAVDTIDGQTNLHFQLWNGGTPQNPEVWLR